MMLAILLVVIACFGFAFAAVVLRADPSGRENRLFAALAGLDALNAGIHGALIFHGYRLTDPFVTRIDGAISAGVAALTIEFVRAFPIRRPMPAWARLAN